MNNAVFIWIVVFAISALVFFGIAAVVAVKGFFDLRLLLRHSNRDGESETNEAEDGFAD
jgi:hypothetical protein